MRRAWTAEEDEIIKMEYATTDNKTLAEKIDRTVASLLNRARKLQVYKPNPYTHPNPNPITNITRYHTCVWHDEGSTIKELAEAFDRPESVIRKIIKQAKQTGMYEKYVANSKECGIRKRVAAC